MGKPPKALVTKERTIHMYAELWHASSCVLKAGQREPVGSAWQFLSSALLTAFAVEAYLNHVGPQIVACWESLERLPPLSKFDLLCELMRVEFKKGERPRQTIEALFEFRNTMAHGRTEVLTPEAKRRDINDRLDSYLGERPSAHWQRLIQTDDFAVRAREDVEEILTKVHAARPDPKEWLFSFGMGQFGATAVSQR
jgi:hypothetical protein